MFSRDPNYNEVSTEVDMKVDGQFKKFILFVGQRMYSFYLAIKNICSKIKIKNEPIYKPEPADLKYIVLKDLTEENSKGMCREHIGKDRYYSFETLSEKPQNTYGLYIVRNRKTGRVIITNGTIHSIRSQYNNDDYEIVEAAIKE